MYNHSLVHLDIMKVSEKCKSWSKLQTPQIPGCPTRSSLSIVRKFGSIPGNLNLLTQFGGRLEVLLNNDYYKYHSFAIHLLQKKNIELHYVTTNEGPILSEAAPVICLSAVLKAIDDGKFKEGTNILISVTGGSRKPPTKKNQTTIWNYTWCF